MSDTITNGPAVLVLDRGEIIDLMRSHAQNLDREIDGLSAWSVDRHDVLHIRTRLTRIEHLLRNLEVNLGQVSK